MKTNASVLTIRVPLDLKHNIQNVAEQQGISVNQLAMYALTKEVQELQTSKYLSKFRVGKSKSELKSKFNNVLEKVKSDKQVPTWDKLE